VRGWRCRWCRGDVGTVVLDLGEQPAADHFPTPDDARPDAAYPLRMVVCGSCGLAQLEDDPTDAEEPRGVEPAALVRQAAEAVSDLVRAGLARPGTTAAEFPSPHGGSWLGLLADAGLVVERGLESGAGAPRQVDLVVDSLGLMHDADQRAALERRLSRLAPDGVLALHVHTLATILRDGTWNALRHGRMNMDVPIAIGITMAYALSIYDTWHSGAHAYFDASVTLLFFLLIGRTLDHVMRNKARAAVANLARMAPRGALVLFDDGTRDYRPIGEVQPGTKLLVGAGERIPVDARVVHGASDIDCSLVNGESAPQPVAAGAEVHAGALNLTGPLTLEAVRAASSSFLAEMIRLMEATEGGRARYRRIADRVSAMYAPVVHLTALVAFIGWMLTGADWHQAITIAIAVLIITCPCALGLAVPMVQVVAARRLFENGIMVKDGSALERLAEADSAIFDKTGTLTLGQPRLTNMHEIPPRLLDVAQALASHSRHPLSQAIAQQARRSTSATFDDVSELPGFGMEARTGGIVWRLGRASWAASASEENGTVLTRNGDIVARFTFADEIRPGARSTIDTLKKRLRRVEMLSGDAEPACRQVAEELGFDHWRSNLLPADKVSRIEELSGNGHKVMMVGDGWNDAPALGAAHVSLAPASAADIGRNAADFVFLHGNLSAVTTAMDVALRAGQLIRQNLGIAIIYNLIAVPIAILGYVTPLVAAIAMSGSSILVISNALRLMRMGITEKRVAPKATKPATEPLRA